jgi:hypothetical protein
MVVQLSMVVAPRLADCMGSFRRAADHVAGKSEILCALPMSDDIRLGKLCCRARVSAKCQVT